MFHRTTRQKTALLELLRSTKAHPTASWLHAALRPDFPGLSLGTVYRNLSVLEAEGEIRTIRAGDGIERFDADTSVHYHVRCTRCGRVDDVFLPPPAGLEKSAERLTGFSISSHSIAFQGVCAACARTHLEQSVLLKNDK